MESKWKKLKLIFKTCKKPLKCFIFPLITVPFPLAIGTKAGWCAYVVLYMAFLWITEAVPLAVTAMIPIFAYPLLGIVKSKDICTEYLTDTNFVFFGSMMMAIGVETSKLHERVALRILMMTGTNPRWLLLGFQISTAFISMWISNTATAAMMLPIVVSVICELDYCRRRQENPTELIVKKSITEIDFKTIPKNDSNIYKALLLSIAFSASIGGTGTIIGTGPNLLMKSYLDSNEIGQVTFANWMVFAVPSMILMLLFLWIWLQVLFVKCGKKSKEKKLNKMVEKVIKEKYENLGQIKFNEKLITVLFLLQVFLWFFRKPQIFPGWGDWFPEGYVTDATVAMTLSLILFILPSKNPFKIEENQKNQKIEENQKNQKIEENQKNQKIEENSKNPFENEENSKIEENRKIEENSKNKNSEIEPIVTWKDMKERFSWGTIILLGGGSAMAKGVQDSGLSVFIGESLSSFSGMPEWAFALIACFLVTLLTEFSSNVATASIFIPLVASVAKAHGTNPLLYVLPATLSSSYAFMFPAATPPNAIVFSAGLLKISELIKTGFCLNIFGYIMVFTITHSYAPLIFDFQSPGIGDGNGNKEEFNDFSTSSSSISTIK